MPLYEYVCQHCGERFEKLVRSATSSPQILCPGCASEAVQRIVSTFATNGSDSNSGYAPPACGPVG